MSQDYLNQPIPVCFERRMLGCVKGDGTLRLEGTEMVIDAVWAGLGWGRQERSISYKEMMTLRPAKGGFTIRLRDQGAGGLLGKRYIHAKFPPESQLMAHEVVSLLRQRYDYPECWRCHSEIDLQTKCCTACGTAFATGVRKTGAYQLIGAACVGAAAGVFYLFDKTRDATAFVVLVAVVLGLIGLLNLAGGKGMRG